MQTSTLAEQVSRTWTMARRPQEGSRRTTTTFGIYPLNSHGVRPHGSEGDKSKSYPRKRLMGRTTRTRIRGACRIRAGSPGPKLGRPHDVYGHGYPSYEGSPTSTGAQDDGSPNACSARTYGGWYRLHTLQGIKRQHEKDLRKNGSFQVPTTREVLRGRHRHVQRNEPTRPPIRIRGKGHLHGMVPPTTVAGKEIGFNG